MKKCFTTPVIQVIFLYLTLDCEVIHKHFKLREQNTTQSFNCFTGFGKDPRNDIGLIKVKWPPLGHKDRNNQLKNVFENQEETERKIMRYQRTTYRETISTPICLTFDKMNVFEDSSRAVVSGKSRFYAGMGLGLLNIFGKLSFYILN